MIYYLLYNLHIFIYTSEIKEQIMDLLVELLILGELRWEQRCIVSEKIFHIIMKITLSLNTDLSDLSINFIWQSLYLLVY